MPLQSVVRASIAFASRCVDGSPLHWRQKLAICVLQTIRWTLNPQHTLAHSRRQLTGASIEAYCHDRGLPHLAVTVPLPDHPFTNASSAEIPPPTLHFVTPTTATADGPTLLYVHGGGYVNPLQAPGHLPFALRCATSCGASRIVFMEYALTSEHCYPVQLIQMVAAVRHLLRHEIPGSGGEGRVKPEDLIIVGDSAGGHLIASLLAHVAQASPYAPPLTELGCDEEKQLRAVALLSPWVAMELNDGSLTANHESDYLSAAQLELFARLFQPSLNEVWALPLEADGAAEVWKAAFPPGSGATNGFIAKRTLITSGAGETLLDSCVRFGREMLHADMVVLDSDEKVALAAGKDLVLTIAPSEAHVQPVLDSALRYAHGWSMKAIVAFLEHV